VYQRKRTASLLQKVNVLFEKVKEKNEYLLTNVFILFFF
jgi:uncharacterized protein YoxC